MNDLLAKKYVKALVEGKDLKLISSVGTKLKEISKVFEDEKFSQIIFSPEVEDVKKVELINSFLKKPEGILVNLIKLLGEKRRLSLLPAISKELESQIAKLNNKYIGVIYTNQKLSNNYVSSIETQFSKKFNVDLSLSQNVCDYDGIKVDIDGLGVEISFSKDRLRSQMIDHILKAV